MHALPNEFTSDAEQATEQLVALSVAYLHCAADLTITAASAQAELLLGWQGESCVGLPLSHVCMFFLGSEHELITVARGELPHFVVEQINIEANEDQPPRYISLVVLPNSPGVLVIVSDVTRQSLQQQRLQQQHHELLLLHEQVAAQNAQLTALNHELTALSQQKTDMLAVATHDLRSPLTTVIGYANMLADGVLGDVPIQHQEPLDTIRRISRQMLDIIRVFLDLRRLEATKVDEPKPIALPSLTDQVVRSFADQAVFAGVALFYAMPDDEMIVDGDPDVLQQAIMNVVSNAIKYCGKGGVVTLQLARTTKTNDAANNQPWCALDVIDNGPGIAPADLERIFEPFFRASTARINQRPGSGLGLAIVQRAMEQHGGQVLVTSEVGQGTTVRLELGCRPQLI